MAEALEIGVKNQSEQDRSHKDGILEDQVIGNGKETGERG